MKINKKQLEILKKHFSISEGEKGYGLEEWTCGGVDMIIYIDKTSNDNLIKQLTDYVENFDIDSEIDMHRESEDYKNAFTIRESIHDFERWVDFIWSVIHELEETVKYYVLCRRNGIESILKNNGVEQYFDTLEQAQAQAQEMRKLVSSADYFVETMEEL